jgi:hypothetical protein
MTLLEFMDKHLIVSIIFAVIIMLTLDAVTTNIAHAFKNRRASKEEKPL